MSVKLDKKEFRKNAKSALTRKLKFQAKCKHYALLGDLERLIKFTHARRILLYMPLTYEVNVCKMRRNLVKNHEIFVPFMQGISLKMVRLRQPFNISKFKVREPQGKKLAQKRLDMAVVPVLGVDGAMARIGHGKGFYDRFFSSLSYRPKIIVFLQIIDCFTDQILTQEHDIRGDIYLTPNKIYIKRGKNDRNVCYDRHGCSGRLGRTYVCQKDKRRQLQHFLRASKSKSKGYRA